MMQTMKHKSSNIPTSALCCSFCMCRFNAHRLFLQRQPHHGALGRLFAKMVHRAVSGQRHHGCAMGHAFHRHHRGAVRHHHHRTLAAIGIDGMKKKRQRPWRPLRISPMLSPDIVTGISLMMLFLFAGIRLGYGTMLLAHITFNLPYVIFSVLPKLRQLNPAHYEAALDLGAKPGYALRKIVLPQILPGIVTGFIFAFTLSIDDFVVSFATSQDVSNLSMTIYSMARRGLSPKINALSTIMFVSVMMCWSSSMCVPTQAKQKGEKTLKKLWKICTLDSFVSHAVYRRGLRRAKQRPGHAPCL